MNKIGCFPSKEDYPAGISSTKDLVGEQLLDWERRKNIKFWKIYKDS